MKKLYTGLLAIVLCGTILTTQAAETQATRGFFTGLVKAQIMEREMEKSTFEGETQPPFASIFPKALENSENFDHFFECLGSTEPNNPIFKSILMCKNTYQTLNHPC